MVRPAEKILKAMKLNGAFFLRPMLDDFKGSASATPPPSIFIANLDFLFFSFLEMMCRPRPTGPIGVTRVTIIVLYMLN